jgi:hypothetical protein
MRCCIDGERARRRKSLIAGRLRCWH